VIAGVDGFRGGWIAAIEGDDRRTTLRAVTHFRELADDRRLTHVAIDMPIGLVASGRRHCDGEARTFLASRWMCVFLAPTWSMLEAGPAELDAIATRDRGTRTSAQERAIHPKIREVNEYMVRCPQLQARVREAHPEIIFRTLRERFERNTACLAPKKTVAGERQRCALLRRVFPDFAANLRACPRGVRRDDVSDAYACLWTARRMRDGTAERYPKQHPPQRYRGLRAEIVY
jgi:predicted RNase H-like nuclease